MTSSDIQKYKKYTVADLIKKAQVKFNARIRARDEGKPCINCGKYRKLQAGHFFPTSTHSYMRFMEDNCAGECLQCNYYNSQSHSYGYRVNLEKRLGKERFDKLIDIGSTRPKGFKWDRFTLIEILLNE